MFGEHIKSGRNPLVLAAFEVRDLLVISAHLQDAKLVWHDVAYFKPQASFGLGLSRVPERFLVKSGRFNGQEARQSKDSERLSSSIKSEEALGYEKDINAQAPVNYQYAGLRIHHVKAVQCLNIDQADKHQMLTLLSVHFDPETPAPAGAVVLSFKDSKFIRLKVECIEVGLKDF